MSSMSASSLGPQVPHRERRDFNSICRFLRRRPSVRRCLWVALCVTFFMQLAQPAHCQAAHQNLNKDIDKLRFGDQVPEAILDPQPIKLPIVDGTEIRFRRLSTSEGLLQTKVAQIVQDD